MSERPPIRRPVAGAAVVALAVATALAITGTGGNEPARSEVVATPVPTPTVEVAAPSPSPVATPSPTPPAPDPHVALRGRLEAALAVPELEVSDGLVSIVIRDAAGRVVLERDGDRSLLPASTMKLVTAAAALRAWGPDHRFVTTALATGPVDDDGTLQGDLALIGGGDPVLATAGYGRYVYPVRPRTPLEELAVRIRTAGIRRVSGHLVADGGRFSAVTGAQGWKPSYFHDFDARHITGLTVDGGLVVELRVPEEEGTPAEDPGTVTAAAPAEGTPGEAAGTASEEEPPTLLLEAIPDGVHPDVRLELSPEPHVEAGRQFQRLLAARDIAVRPEIGTATTRPEGRIVASVSSDPLARILGHTVRRSDNHAADTLFRELGVSLHRDGSWEGGALAVRSALGELDLPWAGVVLADGSGLSRNDRLTARFLADLDAAMVASPFGDTWTSLMAVAGREGTLRHRLRGTAGEGRLFGKTGTLDDVAAVAGTVIGPDGERYHLAVVGNEVAGSEREIVRRIVDELTLVLVGEPVETPASPSDQAQRATPFVQG